MSSASDRELLERYARHDDEAFTMLTKRYERLVYSVCARELGLSDLADDATQETFLLLARSASSLARRCPGSLSGWLFVAARNTARNLRRAEQRRTHYEQGAGMQHVEGQEEQARQLWERVEPGLNEALGQLKPPDREALLLRYFQQESLLEVGKHMGVSENAAQMRVTRALERLRGVLKRGGTVLSVGLLASLLEQHASFAAPIELSNRLSQVAQQGRVLPPRCESVRSTWLPKVFVAVVVSVVLASGLALWQRLPLPDHPQADSRELQALESFFAGSWKGTETGKQNNTAPLTATFQLSRDRQRLTYRFVYSDGREPESGWLTVEKRTGRLVWDGRDVFLMKREGPVLTLSGWERRNTGSDVLWTRVRQRWQREGNRLSGNFERGNPPQVERSLNLLRS